MRNQATFTINFTFAELNIIENMIKTKKTSEEIEKVHLNRVY